MTMPKLNEQERDTLLACLDFCVSQVECRTAYNGNEVDCFALAMSRTHIRRLRAKLFPAFRTVWPAPKPKPDQQKAAAQ